MVLADEDARCALEHRVEYRLQMHLCHPEDHFTLSEYFTRILNQTKTVLILKYVHLAVNLKQKIQNKIKLKCNIQCNMYVSGMGKKNL